MYHFFYSYFSKGKIHFKSYKGFKIRTNSKLEISAKSKNKNKNLTSMDLHALWKDNSP